MKLFLFLPPLTFLSVRGVHARRGDKFGCIVYALLAAANELMFLKFTCELGSNFITGLS